LFDSIVAVAFVVVVPKAFSLALDLALDLLLVLVLVLAFVVDSFGLGSPVPILGVRRS